MFSKKPNLIKIIAKGDKLAASGKHEKALSEYKKALKLDSENRDLYAKLIETHKKVEGIWQENDFVESLEWTMKLQELENSGLKRVHARLTPEWKEVSELLHNLMISKDEFLTEKLIEKIISFGDKAVYPLLDFVTQIKNTKLV